MTRNLTGAAVTPVPPVPVAPPATARRRKPIRGSLVWYGFVVPPFLLLVVFIAYPTFQTFRQSLFRAVGREQEFAGAYQYTRLASDGVFWSALGNTALLGAAFLLIIIPLAVVLASLLNNVRRGATPLKVIYFLPQLTSAVAVALIFNYVFQPDWGLLNGLLRGAGFDVLPQWLANPRYDFTGSRAAVTLLAVWAGLGYFMLVTLAGLQAIPVELYEAAKLDGANVFQIWRHITLPGLRPTFIFLVMTGTVDAMARFGDLWTLGGPGGAPSRSLQTIVMYMFQTGFESGDANFAAAIAAVFFVLLLGITLVSFRTFFAEEFRVKR